MHPFAIMTRRKIADSEPVPYGVMLLAMEPNRTGSVADEIGSLDFDSVAIARARLQAGDPSTAFLERIVDANYAFTQLGKNTESVLHVAIGCETLIDGCLGMCLWEGKTSEQGAAEVFSTDLTPRVKTKLPEILGGNWSLTIGPVGGWYEKVAGLRNRVVHAGYQPDDKEVSECLHAAEGLGGHILDCLYKKFHLYPATAWTFLGTAGFENRGGVTRRATEWREQNDVIASIRLYSRWRTGVSEKVQRRKKSI